MLVRYPPMKLLACIIAVALVAVATGCQSPRTQISVSSLAAQAHQDPLDHLVYRGGDEQYYFIDRAEKTTHRYKVLRSEVSIPDRYLNDVLPPFVLREVTTRPTG